MVNVWMSLKRGFRMCLTIKTLNTKVCFVKTMVYNPLNVNDVNNKKHRSQARSHSKALKLKLISIECERGNDFSRTYVGNFFYSPLFCIIQYTIYIFIFFILTCACIFIFTRSHFNKNNIKTMAYHVNDFKNSFPCHSHLLISFT